MCDAQRAIISMWRYHAQNPASLIQGSRRAPILGAQSARIMVVTVEAPWQISMKR
jgi:hypothetical protein